MAIPAGFDPAKAHIEAQWKVERPIVCCRFDPQGRYVFCGLESATLQRVTLADGKSVPFTGGHDSWVFSLATTPNGETTFSGGGDGKIAVWETASASAPKPIRTIDAHHGWVHSLDVSRDGKLLVSGGNDRMVRLWDASSGKKVRELKGHDCHVYSVRFHPDGKTLLSGDLHGAIRQWEIDTGKELGQFDAKTLYHLDKGQQVDYGGVRGLDVAPDAAFIAAGGLHKATNPLGAVNQPIVQVFDAKTRKLSRTLVADGIPGGVIWGLRYLADGGIVGACGGTSGGFLLFWKTGADKDYHRLKMPASARELDVHPDGLRIATAQHDSHIRIVRLAAKKG